MKITNNIEKIKSLLKFKEGIFYYVQVIQRKKENPELDTSDIKRYQTFITSQKDFDRHIERIKKECSDYNARAYISLIPRSLEKLAKECLLEYAKRVANEEYKLAWSVPNRVALSDKVKARGIYNKPLWLFDVDKIEDYPVIKKIVEEKRIKIVETIDTPNGMHVLVEAFNPSLLADHKSGEDYVFPEGERFTFRPDSNTVLFAVSP